MNRHKKNEANTAVYIFASPLQQILATTIQYLQTVMDWEICQKFSISIVTCTSIFPAALFTTTKTWGATLMPINE